MAGHRAGRRRVGDFRCAAGPGIGCAAGRRRPVGHAYVPRAGRAVSTSRPSHVIGTGRPASCTSAKVVKAIAEGGVITFNCGPRPVTIRMHATAKVINTSHRIVVDGGGKVTLSGGGKRRILYMNTCDKRQTWTTSHCNDQKWPELDVQHMSFEDGNSEVSADRHVELRWRRDLRARWPAEGRGLPLHRQPLLPRGSRPRRCACDI